MNTHKNARVAFRRRVLLVERVLEHSMHPIDAAQALSVSTRTAYNIVTSLRTECQAGLLDRSSRPKCCPYRLAPALRQQIIALRCQRRIYPQTSRATGVPVSAISRMLGEAGRTRVVSARGTSIGRSPRA